MPDLPPGAYEAAAKAIYARRNISREHAMALATAGLDAAAPLLADTVAAKILAHMDEHEPKSRLIGGKPAENQRRRTWRRHFRIAPQVASFAFSTREDILREAAGAIERGEYVACSIPEVPREGWEHEA